MNGNVYVDNEPDLIRRLQDGDIEAFDRLFEQHRRGMLVYVEGMVGDRSHAEDIVQDCFVEFVEKIGRINPEKGASGWLYRVARNRAIDVLRRRKFEINQKEWSWGEKLKGNGAIEKNPAIDLMEKEREIDVQRLLGSLPSKERDLLLLRFYSGLSFREIADILRRPLGTVLWQAHRSLKKLKEIAGEM
ncbi:MAG: RNA polymerase sigma factor [Kiritimatiellae bacterium]|nr:RNA polymerase sigma factor [Kiritimatiellia bacterium]MDD5521101.1 RNA polymerase sigma factor [Kiritimatiellia bacterium]